MCERERVCVRERDKERESVCLIQRFRSVEKNVEELSLRVIRLATVKPLTTSLVSNSLKCKTLFVVNDASELPERRAHSIQTLILS